MSVMDLEIWYKVGQVDLLYSVKEMKTLLVGYFKHLAPYFMPKRFALLTYIVEYPQVKRKVFLEILPKKNLIQILQ